MILPMKFLNKAKRNINLAEFNQINEPIRLHTQDYTVPENRQYILRMMVRNPESNGFRIPTELNWLKNTILELNQIQKQNNLNNQYVYVTVRHGIVDSETDDVWHVDGFSMKMPHVPEQNYIWTNRKPTEYAEQAFPLPIDFNPHRHHLHWYI